MKSKIKVKTIILPDGTYGTEEIINEDEPNSNFIFINLIKKKKKEDETTEVTSELRKQLLESSYLCALLITTLMKLLYKLKGVA